MSGQDCPLKIDGRNYYEILEVERNATPNQIKKKYRKLLLKYHQDYAMARGVTGDELERCRKMNSNINNAYEVIGDAAERQAYDERLAQAEAQHTAPPSPQQSAHPPPPPPGAASGVTLDDIINMLHRGEYEEVVRVVSDPGINADFRHFAGTYAAAAFSSNADWGWMVYLTRTENVPPGVLDAAYRYFPDLMKRVSNIHPDLHKEFIRLTKLSAIDVSVRRAVTDQVCQHYAEHGWQDWLVDATANDMPPQVWSKAYRYFPYVIEKAADVTPEFHKAFVRLSASNSMHTSLKAQAVSRVADYYTSCGWQDWLVDLLSEQMPPEVAEAAYKRIPVLAEIETINSAVHEAFIRQSKNEGIGLAVRYDVATKMADYYVANNWQGCLIDMVSSEMPAAIVDTAFVRLPVIIETAREVSDAFHKAFLSVLTNEGVESYVRIQTGCRVAEHYARAGWYEWLADLTGNSIPREIKTYVYSRMSEASANAMKELAKQGRFNDLIEVAFEAENSDDARVSAGREVVEHFRGQGMWELLASWSKKGRKELPHEVADAAKDAIPFAVSISIPKLIGEKKFDQLATLVSNPDIPEEIGRTVAGVVIEHYKGEGKWEALLAWSSKPRMNIPADIRREAGDALLDAIKNAGLVERMVRQGKHHDLVNMSVDPKFPDPVRLCMAMAAVDYYGREGMRDALSVLCDRERVPDFPPSAREASERKLTELAKSSALRPVMSRNRRVRVMGRMIVDALDKARAKPKHADAAKKMTPEKCRPPEKESKRRGRQS